MDSVSKSPIFFHLNETVNGLCTIRAYNAQKKFIRILEHHIDENLIYYFSINIGNRWLAIRLEFVYFCIIYDNIVITILRDHFFKKLSNLIATFAAVFAVLARDSISAGVAGLSLSYAFNVKFTTL